MFRVISHDDFWNLNTSTSRMGEIDLVYSDIVLAFGEPQESDGCKVSGEWMFHNADTGESFTLYDWKATDLYDGDGPSVKQFRARKEAQRFNVGGNHKGDVEKFKRLILAQIRWVKYEKEAEKQLLGSAIPLFLPMKSDS